MLSFAYTDHRGSKQVRNGKYSQKEFFTVLPALLFSAQSAGQLFSLSPEIARAKTAAVSVFRLLSFRPTILTTPSRQGLRKHSSDPLDSSVESLQKPAKIEFDSVDFSYSSSGGQKVLDNVSFSINDGETVALVGPSGAGKSSIIALFERFFDPQGGQIRLHSKDIRDQDVTELRGRMALLSQVPELFPGSIRYNIALGVAERTVTQEEIEHVAVMCGIHDFISSLPESYATECGSVANSQLSGGQRQRIALARALLRDPEVLLLDEPTSALDAQSERQVQDALQAAEKGRTTILVAHRLASIQHAHKIIVLDGGRVVEQGTHSELVKLGGLYANMARAQAIA
jgi:ATP-binding cassette, subfamily B (MDR/TAP), member 1